MHAPASHDRAIACRHAHTRARTCTHVRTRAGTRAHVHACIIHAHVHNHTYTWSDSMWTRSRGDYVDVTSWRSLTKSYLFLRHFHENRLELLEARVDSLSTTFLHQRLVRLKGGMPLGCHTCRMAQACNNMSLRYMLQGAVLLTVGWSYVGNAGTHSTLLDRVCACSYGNLPKYRSYRVSNTAPSISWVACYLHAFSRATMCVHVNMPITNIYRWSFHPRVIIHRSTCARRGHFLWRDTLCIPTRDNVDMHVTWRAGMLVTWRRFWRRKCSSCSPGPAPYRLMRCTRSDIGVCTQRFNYQINC